MQNIVITIGREFGSGGRYIGSEVAKRLNIPFYDKEILAKTYERNHINYSKLEEFDETKRNSILNILDILRTDAYNEVALNEVYQDLIRKTIEDLALSPCVILGRNSNNILKNKKNAIHIFLYSKDLEFKIQRKMEVEGLTHKEAHEKLKKIDKQREEYYEFLNPNENWKDKDHYDLCIDTGKIGVEKTIELIVNLYQILSQEEAV